MKKHITNVISQYFDKFANFAFPYPLQKLINTAYVNLLKLDMGEFNEPKTYKSLNALFTRALQQKRTLGQSKLISPSDSFISECGEIKEGLAMQIKGFSYGVGELLGEELKSGSYINFYLSPKDYHRYHSPCDMEILTATYYPGKLYPVNFKYLRKVPQLFCKNERVVLKCKSSELGVFYMVFVGALNVGKMVFNFDANIQTNANLTNKINYTYSKLHVAKGDELGYFKMGSTIVMLFEKSLNFSKQNQNIKFGEDLI